MNRYQSFPETGKAGAHRRDRFIARIAIGALATVFLLACAVGAAAFLNDDIARTLGVDTWIAKIPGGHDPSQAKVAPPAAETRLGPKLAGPALPAAPPVSIVQATAVVDRSELGAKLSSDRARSSDKLPALSVARTIDAKPGHPAAFPLEVSPDGVLSENSRIVIHGLPAGTVLSAGHASGAGSWLLTPDELNAKLTITPGGAPGATSDLLIQLAGSNGQVASELHTALKLSGAVEAHVASAAAAMPAAAAPVRSAATPDEIRAWMSHGRDLERVGYLAGARLFFRRAAEGGSAEAAHALGETYDPAEFQKLDVHGMTPDPALAAKWYGRAKVLAAQSGSGQ